MRSQRRALAFSRKELATKLEILFDLWEFSIPIVMARKDLLDRKWRVIEEEQREKTKNYFSVFRRSSGRLKNK